MGENITQNRITKGTIFNIERFAVHDGPGARTLIFMKGCPLNCQWCSTPESQNMFPEMGYYVDKCAKCEKCVEACPVKAITLSNGVDVLTDMQLCDNCCKCAEVCLFNARVIIGKEMTVEEVLDEISKDTVFYWNSGGGVTLGGGDPAMQSNFSREILKACRGRGIHTAIETCGYVENDVFDKMMRYLDLVYLDIKHMSPIEHERLTGKRNEPILETAKRITTEHIDTPFIIRVPIIPGQNDSEENIRNTAVFATQLEKVERIELLPYHQFGVAKYEVLFREYPLEGTVPPLEEHMHHLKEIVESYGIETQIGG